MPTKKVKPNTPGSRHRTAPDFKSISRDKPAGKALIKGKKQSGGRNSHGRKTSRHRGGGHKRRYRTVDFKRNKYGIPAKVQTIEYDPNRSAHIALLAYYDGEKRYIIAPNKLKVDDIILSGEKVEPDVGNAMYLRNMPSGTIIHNIELYPGHGAQLCRSAGTSAQLLAKTERYVTLELPSGETRMVLGECMATVGSISNPEHFNVTLGKAGRNRWKGRRPQTRGVAMNPIDHPMGGGEGKASGGHPRSPWGQSSKGKKTRKRKKLSDRYIIRSRKRPK
jgi:large subunit ribosomal protein L2